jgi:AcrR family transcriptional regulator
VQERANRKRSDGRRTERRILDAAVALATIEGLHGLTIGGLAAQIGMSKSGLYAHFGSKEELQLSVIRRARTIFTDEVLRPGLAHQPGKARLLSLTDAFLTYVERAVFPGGCFFAAAAADVGGRPGALHDRVARHQARWMALLEAEAHTAIHEGELPAGVEPSQLAFELNAVLLAANTAVLLHGDRTAVKRTRMSVTRLLERGANAQDDPG